MILSKAGSTKRARHLAGAVGAEVVEDDGVVIVNRAHWRGGSAFAFCDDDGLDELVGDSLLVAFLESGDGIVRMRFGFAVNHCAVGQLDAFPAVVAVHRVVAAGERGDFADA